MIANGGFVATFVRLGSGSNFYVDVTDWVHLVTPDIVVSESSLAVTEGTSPTATYTVTLNAQPTGGVKVRVSRGDAYYLLNKAGGTQAVSQDLTFTTSTWNTGQAITVIALDDANALAGTSNISHTTVDADTANEYDSASETLTVTVTDDDAQIAVSRGHGRWRSRKGAMRRTA